MKSYELVVSEIIIFQASVGFTSFPALRANASALANKTHQTPKKSTTIAEAYLSVPKNPKTCGNIQQTSRKPLESAE